MIEENENIDLVTIRRQQDFSRAQESYHRAVAEGRLAVRPHTGDGTQPVGALSETAGWGQPAMPQSVQPEAKELQPAGRTDDPEVAWRYTRLAITAGLVVLLLVIWIWQKRPGR